MLEIEILNGIGISDKIKRRASEIYVDAWKTKLTLEYGTTSDSEILDMAIHQMETRVRTYPKGQIFAVYDGKLIGSINTLKVKPALKYLSQGWEIVTGDIRRVNGVLRYEYPHDPEGSYILCIAIQTDVNAGIRGAARKILKRVKGLKEEWDKGIITYSTLMGYEEWFKKYIAEYPDSPHGARNSTTNLKMFAQQHEVVSFHEHCGAKRGAIFPRARGEDPVILMVYKHPHRVMVEDEL